jgi:hypothetical protein
MLTLPFVSETTDEQIIAFFRDALAHRHPDLQRPGIGITLSSRLVARRDRSDCHSGMAKKLARVLRQAAAIAKHCTCGPICTRGSCRSLRDDLC